PNDRPIGKSLQDHVKQKQCGQQNGRPLKAGVARWKFIAANGALLAIDVHFHCAGWTFLLFHMTQLLRIPNYKTCAILYYIPEAFDTKSSLQDVTNIIVANKRFFHL